MLIMAGNYKEATAANVAEEEAAYKKLNTTDLDCLLQLAIAFLVSGGQYCLLFGDVTGVVVVVACVASPPPLSSTVGRRALISGLC